MHPPERSGTHGRAKGDEREREQQYHRRRGDAPRSLRHHAPHPRLRGQDRRPLPGRRRQGHGPQLQGRGGDRRRRLRHAARRRHHRLLSPRPRPLHRQGRAHRPHDGGADGPPDRLLPGPRRLHAHRRHGAQHHGRERHRGRGHAARHRRRPRRQAARDGPGGGRLLRRRRLQPGRLPRIAQPGGGVEAAGDLRLREQPVRALHLLPEHHGRLPGLEPRGVPTRSPASPWTATTASRSISCCARRWTAPAPARGRR